MKQSEFRNFLGDDISWKSLMAIQKNIYSTREAAIADAIGWCSNISITELIIELRKLR